MSGILAPQPDQRLRLPHGATVDLVGGHPVRLLDRDHRPAFEAGWQGARLITARLKLPDEGWLVIQADATDDPLFGRCDAVALAGGPTLAYFQAVDWANPICIPPLNRPGALPPGAGSAILNLIALQAQRRQQPTLRYRGPYPTGALFDTLLDSFRLMGDMVDAFQRFTAAVEVTALSGEIAEVPVDFGPAPFERAWPAEGICVQVRDGLEKVYLRGRAYQRLAGGVRQLRPDGSDYVAVIEIGGAVWAEVARFDERGHLLGGPWPLPPIPDEYLGLPLPDSIRAALAEALPPRAPRLIQAVLRDVLSQTPIYWGNAGDDLALIRNDQIILHAILLERLAGYAPERILPAMAAAIEPVAQRLAQARLAHEFGSPKLGD